MAIAGFGKLTRSSGVRLAAASVLAAGAVAVTAAPAHADTFSYKYSSSASTKVWHIHVYRNGRYAGSVAWNGDPDGNVPGDALMAWDNSKDGYGVVAYLSTGRTASTLGHPSPYSSGWVTGNLPEGHHYQMWLRFKKGGTSGYSKKITVTA